MKHTLLVLAAILCVACTSCSLINPVDIFEATTSPTEYAIPTAAPLGDARFYGEFRLDHTSGITTLKFNGTDTCVMYYYNRSNSATWSKSMPVVLDNGTISTYFDVCPIEEFGEFYQRPYSFNAEGTELTIIGRNTLDYADQPFTFTKFMEQ